MNNEDIKIKDIITKMMYRQSMQMQELSFIIERYIYAVKKVTVKINLYGMYDMEYVNYALTFAVDYFKVKFEATSLFNKDKEFMSINFSS